MGKKLSNNDIEDLVNNWSEEYDPKPIPLEEWRKDNPDAIYIMNDGFYKWINDEYIKIDPKEDFVSE